MTPSLPPSTGAWAPAGAACCGRTGPSGARSLVRTGQGRAGTDPAPRSRGAGAPGRMVIGFSAHSGQQEPVWDGAALAGIRLRAQPVPAAAPTLYHPEHPALGSAALLSLHGPAVPTRPHPQLPIKLMLPTSPGLCLCCLCRMPDSLLPLASAPPHCVGLSQSGDSTATGWPDTERAPGDHSPGQQMPCRQQPLLPIPPPHPQAHRSWHCPHLMGASLFTNSGGLRVPGSPAAHVAGAQPHDLDSRQDHGQGCPRGPCTL